METAGFYRAIDGLFMKDNISDGHGRWNLTPHMISQKVKSSRAHRESVWGAEVYLLLLLMLVLTSPSDGVSA
jgi:hypothetical protein